MPQSIHSSKSLQVWRVSGRQRGSKVTLPSHEPASDYRTMSVCSDHDPDIAIANTT
jgi:hypothetical protein